MNDKNMRLASFTDKMSLANGLYPQKNASYCNNIDWRSKLVEITPTDEDSHGFKTRLI